MKIKTEVLPADQAESIAKAAELLRSGELVALPTETVYGIAADARNGEAVKKIFVAKGRPQDNPLIVHVAGPEMLPGLVSEVPERAQLLMAAFCPGPLTIIMPRGPEVAAECCAGLDTVGIRMPSHPVARAVIEQSGCAFAAPSANLSGKPSPTNAQDVFTDMDGRLPLILDGGECDVGVESTVVSVVGDKPTLFRPGHITLEDLERALGEEVEVSKAILEKLPEGAVVRSPGMKYKHYAPWPGGGSRVLRRSGHGGHPHAQPPGGPCGHRAERLRLCSPQCQPLRQAQPHQCAGCLYRYGRSPAPHSGRRRV